MLLVLLHDVEGGLTAGVERVALVAEAAGFTVERPHSQNGWWPGNSLNDWAERENLADRSDVRCLLGIGSGGQVAFRSAYAMPRLWPVVAAIAPACDLGRWYGRETEIDTLYENAASARQDEAPLFFNPLARPRNQLCWCDPRDESCLPSALRLVSKSESSGVTITSDLETERGDSRDQYLCERAEEIVRWLLDACYQTAANAQLPII